MDLDVAFPLDIVRTDRKKSASIEIVGETVKVIVPKYLSDKRIEDLILKRTSWINQKLKIQSEIVLPKPKEYVSGECFTYLGKNYRLKIVSDSSGGDSVDSVDSVNSNDSVDNSKEAKLKHGYLQIPTPANLTDEKRQNFIKASIKQWYEEHALKRLADKTNRYGEILGVQPRSIKVRDNKSRWGSCSVTGDISYSWRIIIAPHHIVDYVVVHELCHILEHNHSSTYWKHVENTIPSFRECRAWLKLNGVKLFI